MSVPTAYIAVILIWSTTPLAISWSSASFGPELAALARIALALPAAVLLCRLVRVRMVWQRQAWPAYITAGLMIFVAMYSSYIAAGYVPSGLISLFWGLTPLLSGLLAIPLLGDRLSPSGAASILLGCGGLALIFADQLVLSADSLPGMAILLFGVFIYSLSAVTLKKLDSGVHPVAQTTGALLVALPCYTLVWLITGANTVEWSLSDKGSWAVIYLALMGSVAGFFCYFYILKRLRAATVALITLICPLFALLLGHLLNQEPVTTDRLMGAALIGLGLASFFWGDRLLGRLSSWQRL